MWKNVRIFYLKIFIFLVVKVSIYLNRHVFVMYLYSEGYNENKHTCNIYLKYICFLKFRQHTMVKLVFKCICLFNFGLQRNGHVCNEKIVLISMKYMRSAVVQWCSVWFDWESGFDSSEHQVLCPWARLYSQSLSTGFYPGVPASNTHEGVAVHTEKNIMKTRLCNFDPLKPHFCVVKLGFTGDTLFFLFLLKNIDCG